MRYAQFILALSLIILASDLSAQINEQLVSPQPIERVEETVKTELVPEHQLIGATTDDIFTMVEKAPSFPGGNKALMAFLSNNLKYPASAMENGIQGRVALQFVVERDGSITNGTILREIGGGCGEEGLRLLSLMPKWEPGQQNGKPVRVKYTMPLLFKLEG
jgi:periplasmic protein TonB